MRIAPTKTNKLMSFDIGDYWTNKKAIVVPEDIGDGKCGLYAIAIAELNPPKNPGRITKAIKEHIKTYSIEGIGLSEFEDDYLDETKVKRTRKFTMSGGDTVKFERQNPHLRILALAANTYEKGRPSVIKRSKSPNVILLLFKNQDGVCYWTTVRDYSRLKFSTVVTSVGCCK